MSAGGMDHGFEFWSLFRVRPAGSSLESPGHRPGTWNWRKAPALKGRHPFRQIVSPFPGLEFS
jgi:hypothetical protein